MIPRLALDTNAYRALDDGHPGLAARVAGTAQLGLPITVLGELYFGLLNGNKQQKNIATLNKFLTSPRIEVLQVNQATAKLFGEIATELRRVGRPIQQNDMWIAALCKQYGYVLASADAGFAYITGLESFNFTNTDETDIVL